MSAGVEAGAGRAATTAASEPDAASVGFTRQVAERIASVSLGSLPAEVLEVARQCVLDWLGVTLAGSQEEPALLLLEELTDSGGSGSSTVVGHRQRLGPFDAALVNGTSSHALDYDDVNQAMFGHPSVPILAGLLAAAEAGGAAGADVLVAFVAGYEAECIIGRALGVEHYQRGFHSTATAGTFGAAAACARLNGLDASQIESALGIAATQAAGLKSMFGTMCKPLHAGLASRSGLLAARLAARGFSTASAAIETEQGFASTHSTDFDPERGLRPPAGGWHLTSNLFKYHAACFQTHSTIEGLRRIREAENLRPEELAEVVVHADAMQLRMCNIAEPTTGLEAKFSLRQTATYALAGVDTAAADSYSESVVSRPDLLALRSLVRVVPDGETGRPTSVEVTLRDGRRFSAAHDVSVPEADLARQRARLEEKFSALSSPVVGTEPSGTIAALVGRLQELAHVGELLDLTRPGDRADQNGIGAGRHGARTLR